MQDMGYSIDWRREFTTIDNLYSKFITWQFKTLANDNQSFLNPVIKEIDGYNLLYIFARLLRTNENNLVFYSYEL